MTPATLISQASAVFGVSERALMGPSRTRYVTQARHATAWALRTRFPDLSLASIGELLGGRDHSTIAHSLATATTRQQEPPFAAQCQRLLEVNP